VRAPVDGLTQSLYRPEKLNVASLSFTVPAERVAEVQ
jgi:hypothetical protein